MANEYFFLDEWDVEAPIEKVFEALADSRTYPLWWTPVYLKAESDGPPKVGRIAYHHFKGRLPYDLRLRSEIVELVPPTRIAIRVAGDLTGRGVWSLQQRGDRVHVVFDWLVMADKVLLKILTPVLKPLFRWNHAWAIARAKEGLEKYAKTH